MTESLSEHIKTVRLPAGTVTHDGSSTIQFENNLVTTSIQMTMALGQMTSGPNPQVQPLNLGLITPATRFKLSMKSGEQYDFNLGMDPTFTAANQATKRSAVIKWFDINGIHYSNTMRLSWTSTRLTVSITQSNKGFDNMFGGALASDYARVDEDGHGPTSFRDLGALKGSFGPVVTGVNRPGCVFFVNGTCNVTDVDYPNAYFELNNVQLRGSFDSAPPTLTVAPPPGGIVQDNGSASFWVTVRDGHGVEGLTLVHTATGQSVPDVDAKTLTERPYFWGPHAFASRFDVTGLAYGRSVLEARSVDVANRHTAVPVYLYRRLPLFLSGRWEVPLEAAPGDARTPGHLTLTVSQTGAVTGSLRLQGQSAAKSLTGYWSGRSLALHADQGKPTQLKATGLLVDGTDTSEADVRMELQVERGIGDFPELVAEGTAFRVPFSSTRPLAVGHSYLGRFNAFTQADAGLGIGHSHFFIVTSKAGSHTITGRLSDGTAFTASGVVGASGQVPFFVSLYSNKGSFQSMTDLDAASPVMSLWIRPSNLPDKQFPTGFEQGLTTSIGRYTTPGKNQRILGLADANASAVWSGDGIPEANVIQQALLVSTDHKITPNGSSPTFKATLTIATGIIAGTFTLPTTPAVQAAFSSMIVGDRVYGHYTAPGPAGATLKRYGKFELKAPAVP